MGSSNGIEPRRLALRYVPPGIIVEYVYHATVASQIGPASQLYHHEIDLGAVLETPTSTGFTDERVASLVHSLVEQHADVLGDRKVSSQQLARLVKKLGEHHESLTRAAAAPAVPPASILPQADYNRVSETQLKLVKQRMDHVFEQHMLRPGQEGFQYDKQVVFQPATEASDWDDE